MAWFKNEYSLISIIDRWNVNSLYQNEEVLGINKEIVSITEDQKRGRLDKGLYGEFGEVIFLNYVPLDIFKLVVKDLYEVYKRQYLYGQLDDFLESTIEPMKYEFEQFLLPITQGKVNHWDTHNDISLYRYTDFDRPFSHYYAWKVFAQDSLHFYETYLNSILLFFKDEIKQYLNNEPQPGIISTVDIASNLKWIGTQTEFMELIKALVASNSVKGTQKDLTKVLSQLLNFKINSPDKLIQDIKLRSIGGETLFLDKLKESLIEYLSKKNTR